MKKLLLICICTTIVGILFVAGCVGGEKVTDTKTSASIESPSSGHLINPTTLLKGYLSSDYRTYAKSKMDSFEVEFQYFDQVQKPTLGLATIYEGDIPAGKKRVATFFKLSNNNNENPISMEISILESDSDSKFKKSFSDLESNYQGSKGYVVKTNLIGDYSVLFSGMEDVNSEFALIIFSNKNYVVSIATGCKDKEICQTETLKVAKEINRRLD